MPSNKKICIIGLGYIGLPTAALLANRSYSVHGVDISHHAVDTINRGEIHIVEPELDTFVHAGRSVLNARKALMYLSRLSPRMAARKRLDILEDKLRHRECTSFSGMPYTTS